jgi:D-alanyl-lipoteichoic acid acyltransferase DltB (MBOAT superfamily)
VRAGSLLEVATWLSLFLTIASGPITRPSELFPQLRKEAEPQIEANRAFGLILRGLFKKMVLASFVATAIADDVFASPVRHSAPEVLVGIYGYAAQLYLDFSGYTDIAIGCALLLGLHLPDNFRAPYAARSITEFWTRWHITLSRWLRDFVFTPLALRSSRTLAATCRNLIIVMLVAGLWHGAAWTFVAFGAIHGVALAAERIAREVRRRRGSTIAPTSALRLALSRLVTFHVICLGWVFFRADSLGSALDILGRLGTGLAPSPAITALLVAVITGVLAVQLVPTSVHERVGRALAAAGPASTVVACAVALVAIDVFGPDGVPPFLYFGF